MISFVEKNSSSSTTTNSNNNNSVNSVNISNERKGLEKPSHQRFQITKASKAQEKQLSNTNGSKSQQHFDKNVEQSNGTLSAASPPFPNETHLEAPSTQAAPLPATPLLFNTVENNEVICSHLYTTAYLNGLYSDLIVRIQQQDPKHSNNLDGVSFKLHKIMALRSPVLARLMKENSNPTSSNNGQILSLQLTTSDPFLTRHGLGIAFGHLYASYAGLLLDAEEGTGRSGTESYTEERTLMLRSVLSAARLLELPDLSRLCIEYMRQLIKMNSVVGMAKFLSCADGASEAGGVGAALQDLKDAVFTYLCKAFLDDVLEKKGIIWGGNPGSKGYVFCVQTFAQLPFEWIKGVVESKYFDAPSEMERFNFAKAVVDLRAYQNTKNDGAEPNTMLAGVENVLLSFGGKATGVTLVRKPTCAPGNSNASSGASGSTERRVWKASQSLSM